MARTPSNMIPLQSKAPDFTLPDVISGEEKSLTKLKGEKGTFIMFICNHCPFVIHVMDTLISLANQYKKDGINFIAISSNDVVDFPEDSPENMTLFAKRYQFTFPYLFDGSQEVAKNYDAACTPDFYLYDDELNLTYRGQLDGSRPENEEPKDGESLIEALDYLLNNKGILENQTPSIGCNIKWK